MDFTHQIIEFFIKWARRLMLRRFEKNYMGASARYCFLEYGSNGLFSPTHGSFWIGGNPNRLTDIIAMAGDAAMAE